MNIDTHIAAELGELAERGFRSSDFFWRNYISWVERGMPSMPPEDRAALRVDGIPEAEQIAPASMPCDGPAGGTRDDLARAHLHNIPIIGTIDSATGVITHTAPLSEPPAPPAEYATGRMSFAAWLASALGIAVAVAIAAGVVLVERVKGRSEE